MDSIEKDIMAIVAKVAKVPASSLTPDTDLRVDLNVDSLQGLQIVAALENKFGITVPDEELDMYTTVRAIVKTVKDLQP